MQVSFLHDMELLVPRGAMAGRLRPARADGWVRMGSWECCSHLIDGSVSSSVSNTGQLLRMEDGAKNRCHGAAQGSQCEKDVWTAGKQEG